MSRKDSGESFQEDEEPLHHLDSVMGRPVSERGFGGERLEGSPPGEGTRRNQASGRGSPGDPHSFHVNPNLLFLKDNVLSHRVLPHRSRKLGSPLNSSHRRPHTQ